MAIPCQAQASRFSAEVLVRRYMALYDALLTAPSTERTQALAEATR